MYKVPKIAFKKEASPSCDWEMSLKHLQYIHQVLSTAVYTAPPYEHRALNCFGLMQ